MQQRRKRKKDEKESKKQKGGKAGDVSGNSKRKSSKKKLKKQMKHTVDSILNRKSFVPASEESNEGEAKGDSPDLEIVVAGEASAPKFSDVTAEEFLRRHKRDINCLSSDVMVTRKDAILKFLNIFVHRVEEELRPTDDVCIEIYEDLMKPLMKRFADKVNIADWAASNWSTFFVFDVGYGPDFMYLYPVITERSSTAFGYDEEAKEFVRDPEKARTKEARKGAGKQRSRRGWYTDTRLWSPRRKYG